MRKEEKEIDKFLLENRAEMIRSVCELVQIPSVAQDTDPEFPYGKACAQALKFCEELAANNGLHTREYEHYGVEIKFSEQAQGKRLLFAAHTDVVPAAEGNEYPPFGGIVSGDYIIGRGVVDDKAPLLAVLYAMIYLRKKKIPLQMDLRLFCGSHEETDMEDIVHYLEKEGQPDFGLAVDDDFPVTNGEKSVLQFELRKYSAEDEKGDQKWGKNGYRIEWEELMSDSEGEVFGLCVCTEEMGKTECRGERTEEGVYQFDIRIPVGFSIHRAKKEILRFAEEKGLQVKFLKADEGYYISGDEGIPKLLTDLYNQITQVCEKPYVMKGCTYARRFRRGCGFGAGNPREVKPFAKGHGGAHQPDEAHHIEVFLHAVKMYILGILAVEEYWKE